MILALLVLLVQGRIPNVGDTVWVERNIGAPGTAVVRPQAWSLGTLGQQLGPAIVESGPAGAVVRYPLVLWYPGDHVLTMPGPVLVRRDGRSDTLAAATVRLRVSSVLPEGSRRADLPPRPASIPVPLAARGLIPLVLLTGLVLLGVGVAAVRWRRTGKPVPPRTRRSTPPSPDALKGWVRDGEYRTALHEWAWMLADRLRTSQDLGQIARVQRLLDEIAAHSFAPRGPAELADLCERAEEMART